MWHECAATDYFHVGFCRASWGFGLVALTSFRRSEGSISLKCCPHERSFISLLFPEPQSLCGCWTVGTAGRRSQTPILLLLRGDRQQLPLDSWNSSLCHRTAATLLSSITLCYHVFLTCLCCKYLSFVVDLFMEFCLQQCLPGEMELIWFGRGRQLEWDRNAGPANLRATGCEQVLLVIPGGATVPI